MLEAVSIVIPVYNVEKYLGRCLQTVINQSYKNIEIILSDDGSTDGSGLICDEAAKNDSRVKVIHQTNQGLSEARNRGLRIAKGDYICFVDSDDWVDKDYILKLYYAIKKTGSDISECKYKRSSEYNCNGIKNGHINVLTCDEALNLLCNSGYEKHIVTWNKLYKKELFNDVWFPVGKLHEDEFTTHKLFASAKKIAFVDDELYFYFQNNNGITKSKIGLKRLDSVDALVERVKYFLLKKQTLFAKKTTYLLFKLFCDFAKTPKESFIDYDSFVEKLNNKYKLSKDLIDSDVLNIIERHFFRKSKNDVLKLAKTEMTVYYAERIKTKFNNLVSAFKPNPKPPFLSEIKHSNEVLKPRAFILSSVEYLNYGDLAIGEAIKQYVSKFFNVVEISQKDTLKYIKKVKMLLNTRDVIVLPGGGNMGDAWKYDEDIRRLILEQFPKNRIIIFPQSISYKDFEDQYFLKSVELYNRNKNLLICVRDKVSLNIARKYYKHVRIMLLPDTVFLLDCNAIHKQGNDNAALCFRDDKEQSPNSIFRSIEIIDELHKSGIHFDIINTVSCGNISLVDRHKYVFEKINQISSYKLVITDRLHCIIFCALTGTPCIALNNSNNKIKNFIETWLPDNKCILYLNNNDKINSIFNRFNDYKYKSRVNLEKKFKELENVFDEWSKI